MASQLKLGSLRVFNLQHRPEVYLHSQIILDRLSFSLVGFIIIIYTTSLLLMDSLFTHDRRRERSPNHLLSPSVKTKGAPISFPLLSPPFRMSEIYHPLSAVSWKNHFVIIKISHTPTLNHRASPSNHRASPSPPLKLGKYSFETMFHFQLALQNL